VICLIRPPAVECFRFATTSISLPLGLAYIAGSLEAAGHELCVIDAVGEGPSLRTRYCTGFLIGLPLEEVAERIPAEATLVGISVVFTHEWPQVVRLTQLVKERRPDISIVVGGEHVTSMTEFCLMTSPVDFAVLGEGEETIVELADALKRGLPLAGINGLAFRDGDRITVNPRRSRRGDVDSIPWPAWHHFQVETYHENRFVGAIYHDSITMPILATRGCPYQCTYCSSAAMWTPRWIPRDPVKVVDEIQHYVENYGARNFPFQDLTAIVKKQWIVDFCQELLDRKLEITWQLPSGTRSEAIDAEVADLLRRSGMSNMAYAPESGSETTRRLIKKRMHRFGPAARHRGSHPREPRVLRSPRRSWSLGRLRLLLHGAARHGAVRQPLRFGTDPTRPLLFRPHAPQPRPRPASQLQRPPEPSAVRVLEIPPLPALLLREAWNQGERRSG
jgi:hypothetical protein